jgi:hypothetical protein
VQAALEGDAQANAAIACPLLQLFQVLHGHTLAELQPSEWVIGQLVNMHINTIICTVHTLHAP